MTQINRKNFSNVKFSRSNRRIFVLIANFSLLWNGLTEMKAMHSLYKLAIIDDIEVIGYVRHGLKRVGNAGSK